MINIVHLCIVIQDSLRNCHCSVGGKAELLINTLNYAETRHITSLSIVISIVYGKSSVEFLYYNNSLYLRFQNTQVPGTRYYHVFHYHFAKTGFSLSYRIYFDALVIIYISCTHEKENTISRRRLQLTLTTVNWLKIFINRSFIYVFKCVSIGFDKRTID